MLSSGAGADEPCGVAGARGSAPLGKKLVQCRGAHHGRLAYVGVAPHRPEEFANISLGRDVGHEYGGCLRSAGAADRAIELALEQPGGVLRVAGRGEI